MNIKYFTFIYFLIFECIIINTNLLPEFFNFNGYYIDVSNNNNNNNNKYLIGKELRLL